MHTPRSYNIIAPADVAGWEIMESLPPELLPVEVLKRDTAERAWAQVADTRAQTLVASMLEQGGERYLGVVLKTRPRLVRPERGKPASDFPAGMQIEAVSSVELPTVEDSGVDGFALGELYANPAHGMKPTHIRFDYTSKPRTGLHYIGQQELREVLARGGVDARMLAAILMIRAKQQMTLAQQPAEQGMEFVQRVLPIPPLPATVLAQHTLQARLGIAHVTAGWIEQGIERQQLVRIENGTAIAAPGMALPHYRRNDDVLQMGVVENWRPLVATNGRWLTEIPGGFKGWRNELKGEFGAEVAEQQVQSMPTIVADPSTEGFDLDLRSMEVRTTGSQELDETEDGMMVPPSWLSDRRLIHFTQDGTIADGRTMAAMQMLEILQGADFLRGYRAWQTQIADEAQRRKGQ